MLLKLMAAVQGAAAVFAFEALPLLERLDDPMGISSILAFIIAMYLPSGVVL